MYVHMKERLGKLPFDLEALRRKLFPVLGKPCPFCGAEMTAKVFSIDHMTPVSRGGSKRLMNLAMVCGPCNRAKSDLTWEEFTKLLATLKKLGVFAQTSVLRRLKSIPFWLR